MGPLVSNIENFENLNLLIALFIGVGFGFVLEQSGFSSSRKLAGVFYGYDMTVMKVFFTAAITAGLGLLFFSLFGWIDLSLIYVNNTFIYSAIIGGVLMGIGFILGGFCPGTSVCAAAIGKIDAMIFILGIIIGVAIFGFGFPLWETIYKANPQGPLKISDFIGISDGLFMLVLIVMAIGMFYGAEWVEKKFPREEY
ncbi:MAG: YeeE/YedE thiosulfate transporter family protein [Bacteroidota bacterium]